VFRVSPARAVLVDEIRGAFAEGFALRRGDPLRLPSSGFGIERV
jgi:hypothetical protein